MNAQKKKNISYLCSKKLLKLWGKSCSFNDFNQRKMALSCSRKLSALLRGIASKNNGDFYYLNCLHFLWKKTNLNQIKKYVKIKIFVM